MKILIPIVLIAIALGVYAATMGTGTEKDPGPTSYSVAREDLRTELLLSGSVINEQIVTMTALLDGQLLSTNANEGDRVNAGEVLARIDDRYSNARLAKNEAAQLAAVGVGQAHIKNHQIIDRFFGTRHRIRTIPRLEDIKVLGHDQLLGQRLAQVIIIVNKQDFLELRHDLLLCGPS